MTFEISMRRKTEPGPKALEERKKRIFRRIEADGVRNGEGIQSEAVNH